MTRHKSSARKLAANRTNARASTGPRTAEGKARAARNARRHGLSIPILHDPTLSAEAQTLAREIAGKRASKQRRGLATRIAEAQIELVRVRRARYHVLARAIADRDYFPSRGLNKRLTDLMRCVDLLDQGKEIPKNLLYLFHRLEGPEKLANILMDYVQNAPSMERYERRAFSTRKFAIRDFDHFA